MNKVDMERPRLLVRIRRSDANDEGMDSSASFHVFLFSTGLYEIEDTLGGNRGPAMVTEAYEGVQIFLFIGVGVGGHRREVGESMLERRREDVAG